MKKPFLVGSGKNARVISWRMGYLTWIFLHIHVKMGWGSHGLPIKIQFIYFISFVFLILTLLQAQAWWYTPVILAIQEAEGGGLRFEASPRKVCV
jgi:hypothetical protein